MLYAVVLIIQATTLEQYMVNEWCDPNNAVYLKPGDDTPETRLYVYAQNPDACFRFKWGETYDMVERANNYWMFLDGAYIYMPDAIVRWVYRQLKCMKGGASVTLDNGECVKDSVGASEARPTP